MTVRTWLRSAALIVAGAIVAVVVVAPPAYSRKKETPTPTATMTPTATATPETKVWNFDSDKAGQIADGWQDLDGAGWQVFSDPTAPSQPNDFGLPNGGLWSAMWSLRYGLEYHPKVVMKDPTEYSDFTLEAQFKPIKGYFDCSGGLIIRYVDPDNYYVLAFGCPSDYVQLLRMYQKKMDQLQQKVVQIDIGNWYKIKIEAQGDHFISYAEGKMLFDVQDSKIAKGRIGLWTSNDSQARFDNLTLTLPLAGAAAGEASAPAAGTPPPPPPP